MGVASSLVLSNLGAAYGTAKSGVSIASLDEIDHLHCLYLYTSGCSSKMAIGWKVFFTRWP